MGRSVAPGRSVSTTPSPNPAADVGYSRAVERTLASSGEAWAIATPHSAASETGAAAFRAGGNAVDAALAAAVTLAVAYPHNCAVGGDLFALVRRPVGDVITINASGAAPGGLTIDSIHASDGSFAERGPFTITVPGVVGGWDALSELGSRFGFRDAFEPAIGFAANGLPVARSLAAAIWDDKERSFSAIPDARALSIRGADRFGKATFFANPRWHIHSPHSPMRVLLPSTAGRSGAPGSTP